MIKEDERWKAISLLSGLRSEYDCFNEKEEPFYRALSLGIKCVETLEQEPRKGKWISKPHVYGVTYCSECNFELKIDDTNYCPNCGAEMESEE